MKKIKIILSIFFLMTRIVYAQEFKKEEVRQIKGQEIVYSKFIMEIDPLFEKLAEVIFEEYECEYCSELSYLFYFKKSAVDSIELTNIIIKINDKEIQENYKQVECFWVEVKEIGDILKEEQFRYRIPVKFKQN